jgi:DUF971 family protein
MTKLTISITDENIACWKKYKIGLANAARRRAEEREVKLGKIIITDDEAISGLFNCVEEEGIFCWELLWKIVERTALKGELEPQ